MGNCYYYFLVFILRKRILRLGIQIEGVSLSGVFIFLSRRTRTRPSLTAVRSQDRDHAVRRRGQVRVSLPLGAGRARCGHARLGQAHQVAGGRRDQRVTGRGWDYSRGSARRVRVRVVGEVGEVRRRRVVVGMWSIHISHWKRKNDVVRIETTDFVIKIVKKNFTIVQN